MLKTPAYNSVRNSEFMEAICDSRPLFKEERWK
jgi:hypothetical protein